MLAPEGGARTPCPQRPATEKPPVRDERRATPTSRPTRPPKLAAMNAQTPELLAKTLVKLNPGHVAVSWMPFIAGHQTKQHVLKQNLRCEGNLTQSNGGQGTIFKQQRQFETFLCSLWRAPAPLIFPQPPGCARGRQ